MATSPRLLLPSRRVAFALLAGFVLLIQSNIDRQTMIAAAAVTAVQATDVMAVSPSQGPDTGFTLVTITGQNFVAGATVTFGGAAATQVTVVNATTITARTPILPSTIDPAVVVDVAVTTVNGTAVLPGGFTYIVSPRLRLVSPPEGPPAGGRLVFLRGVNFAPDATVTFDGTPAASVLWVDSTRIDVTTPPHAVGLAGVEVRDQGGTRTTSIPNAFSYGAPAVVGALGPVVRASLASDGSQSFQGPAAQLLGGLSGNGRFVLLSWSGNGFVPGDVNNRADCPRSPERHDRAGQCHRC
jgi:hypothetical protein